MKIRIILLIIIALTQVQAFAELNIEKVQKMISWELRGEKAHEELYVTVTNNASNDAKGIIEFDYEKTFKTREKVFGEGKEPSGQYYGGAPLKFGESKSFKFDASSGNNMAKINVGFYPSYREVASIHGGTSIIGDGEYQYFTCTIRYRTFSFDYELTCDEPSYLIKYNKPYVAGHKVHYHGTIH